MENEMTADEDDDDDDDGKEERKGRNHAVK